MVIFVVTPEGFKKMESEINSGEHSVWLSNGILSDTAITNLRSANIAITVFNYCVDVQNTEQRYDALETIKEHHPNEEIWVEWQLSA